MEYFTEKDSVISSWKLFKYGLVVLSFLIWIFANIYMQLVSWPGVNDHQAMTGDKVSNNGQLSISPNEYDINFEPCPQTPPNLVGTIPVNLTVPESLDVLPCVYTSVPPLIHGGRWKPDECTSNNRLAVVMTHRNRTKNLKLILQHLHPFLQKQQIDYQIFVVEPPADLEFNRGILKNIGFAESAKYGNFTCVVFQDIDLLPENDKNLYDCSDTPQHLMVAVDTHQYQRLFGGNVFGGAVLYDSDQFRQVNGYSNLYFGWGAEDDDLLDRTISSGINIKRPNTTVGRYVEAKHTKDVKGATVNAMYKARKYRKSIDGLNSLQYEVVRIVYHTTCTLLDVNYNDTKYRTQVAELLEEIKSNVSRLENEKDLNIKNTTELPSPTTKSFTTPTK